MLIHTGTLTIETPRLLLRKAAETDAQPMFAHWASDPEVTKFLTWPTHSSVDITKLVLKSWAEGYADPQFYQWMIVLKELGQPVGTIGVVRMEEETGEAEIGYCLSRNWWYQGIASEALQAVIRYLMDSCGFACISAKHHVDNPRSGAVMQRCGMAYVETVSENLEKQGTCDVACYRIRKQDAQG